MILAPPLGFAGRAAGLALTAALLSGCAAAERTPGESRTIPSQETRLSLPGVVVTRNHIVLGSDARVTISAPDSASAEAALASAFEVADSIEGLLSTFRPGSEINAINGAAGQEPVPVSPWTQAVIASALEWAERSGGAFDPTVGPLVEAWGFGRSEDPTPSPAGLEAARRLVGWQKVRLDPTAHTVFLTEPGMILDMRSASKGFALDRMREVMTAEGVTSAIMDINDDMLFFGEGPESSDRWSVSLPNPYEPGRSFARFELPPGGLSTSATLDRAIVIRGVRYGHLIDPRTGRPVQGLASVSVYAADGLTSDILATAVYVLGPLDGPRFVEQWPGVEAVFVTEPPPRDRSVVVVTTGLEAYRKELEPPYRPGAPED